MRCHLFTAAVALCYLVCTCPPSRATSSEPFHTFYGEVMAVDTVAKSLTIKSGGRTLLFHYNEQTKIDSLHRYVAWEKVRPGEGATVVMRVGEGNIGIALRVHFDDGAAFAKTLKLYVARTTSGETVSGLAVENYVVEEPGGEAFARGLNFGSSHSGVFVLSIAPDGSVLNVTAAKSLGYSELDTRAGRWLRKWRFRPNSVTQVQIPVSVSRGY